MKFFIICSAILAIQGVSADTVAQTSKYFNRWIARIKRKGNKKVRYAFSESTKKGHFDIAKYSSVVNNISEQLFTNSYILGVIIDKILLTKLQSSNKKNIENYRKKKQGTQEDFNWKYLRQIFFITQITIFKI